MELVDTLVLEASAERRGSSSLPRGTTSPTLKILWSASRNTLRRILPAIRELNIRSDFREAVFIRMAHVKKLDIPLLLRAVATTALLLASPAHAGASLFQRRTTPTGIFLPLTEPSALAAEKQKEIAPLLPAVFSADFDKMNCTGTYISNQGHFLTADHCIQSCFALGADWEKYVEYISYEDPDMISTSGGYQHPEYFVFKRFRTDAIKRDNIHCEVKINGVKKTARLVAAGKGRLFPYSPDRLKSPKLRSQYRELQDQGVWAASDFAVLQLIDQPKTQCLPLGSRAPEIGEKLRAISYTCISAHSQPQNPGGDVPFYTEGIVATPDFYVGQNGRDMLTDGSTPKNTFWSNLAAESCSSGSSALGSDGTILGVFNMLRYGHETLGPLTDLIRLSGIHEVNVAIATQAPDEKIHCEH